MNLIVYHISNNYIGDKIIMEPRVPSSRALYEDAETPRICVCLDLLSCALKKDGIDLHKVKDYHLFHYRKPRQFFVYSTVINVRDLYKPSKEQVPDQCNVLTEYWIKEPTEFIFEGDTAKFSEHFTIDSFETFIRMKNYNPGDFNHG